MILSIIGYLFLILGLFYVIIAITENPCKDLGFDGISDSGNCYNKIYAEDGTYKIQIYGKADFKYYKLGVKGLMFIFLSFIFFIILVFIFGKW